MTYRLPDHIPHGIRNYVIWLHTHGHPQAYEDSSYAFDWLFYNWDIKSYTKIHPGVLSDIIHPRPSVLALWLASFRFKSEFDFHTDNMLRCAHLSDLLNDTFFTGIEVQKIISGSSDILFFQYLREIFTDLGTSRVIPY